VSLIRCLPFFLSDIAYAHLDASVFAVIVQTKMLFTAFFFVLVLHKKLAKKQVYSLILLTVGVMLCSMKPQSKITSSESSSGNTTKGIVATLIIAICSGFASVYTEKVIKSNASSSSYPSTPSIESTKKDLEEVDGSNHVEKDIEMASLLKNHHHNNNNSTSIVHSSSTEKGDHTILSSNNVNSGNNNNNSSNSNSSNNTTTPSPPIKYSLAYTQVQLALVSLILLGVYVIMIDHVAIIEKGFFYNFDVWAFLSTVNSAVGGLIVAGVLKYADSVLKNYSTAVSVLLTGIASYLIFNTQLPVLYWMGLINVTCSIFLYNASGLDDAMF